MLHFVKHGHAHRHRGREGARTSSPSRRPRARSACASACAAGAARASSTRSRSTRSATTTRSSTTTGIRLIVDPASMRYVDGSEVDYTESLMGSGFEVNNPNVVASCGCGSSFRIADEEPSCGLAPLGSPARCPASARGRGTPASGAAATARASSRSSRGVRQLLQAVGQLGGAADSQVAHRQDVRAAEVEDQEHVGRPLAEALDGRELRRPPPRPAARRGGRARARRPPRARPASAGRRPSRARGPRRAARPGRWPAAARVRAPGRRRGAISRS